ncbi:hypothetical protein FS837_004177, partial [Tulasnella sp. UAMH 9824]
MPARNGAALSPQRRLSVVEQDRDDEDEKEDAEDDGTDGEEAVGARREDVTAHLATDDEVASARLHQSTSAPSAPPAADFEDEGHLSPPSPPPPTLPPAPPAITSAHLFLLVPPPPPHEPSDLPQYAAEPSAPSLLGPEKLLVLASAPENFAVSGP